MRTTFALCLILAACGAPAMRGPAATLPDDSIFGAGDPTRAAILTTAYAFGAANLVGNPAEGAAAVARLEHLATEIPQGPRWRHISPLASLDLDRGVADARGLLGIPASAPPQAVIDSLFASRRALLAGDAQRAEAALTPDLFPAGGRATLDRLAALPPLPAASRGAAAVQRQMDQNNRGDDWND